MKCFVSSSISERLVSQQKEVASQVTLTMLTTALIRFPKDKGQIVHALESERNGWVSKRLNTNGATTGRLLKGPKLNNNYRWWKHLSSSTLGQRTNWVAYSTVKGIMWWWRYKKKVWLKSSDSIERRNQWIKHQYNAQKGREQWQTWVECGHTGPSLYIVMKLPIELRVIFR